MATKPRKPAGLKAAGTRVWSRIVGTYDLRDDELRILEDACREADLIDRLQAEIDEADSLMVRGSMGQPVVSPLVAEVRQHRATLKSLLGALKLPDDPAEPGGETGTRSTQARASAAARWRKPA